MTRKSIIPKVGGHVSAAGGVANAVANAVVINADCIQIFGSSPRAYQTRMPTKEEVEAYKKAQSEHSITPVFLHAPYLVNLGSVDGKIFGLSQKSLSEHMEIAELIKAQGVIFHTGAGKEAPKEESMKQVIKGIKKVLEKVPGETQLIMENSATTKKLGATPAEIGTILKEVNSSRVKVCIDLAHTFEAGNIDEYTPEKITVWLSEWDREVGLDNIVVLHVNDSKTETGSSNDKHENIGEGYIGLDGFRALAAEKRLRDKAWILEVPGKDKAGPDKANVEKIKNLF